MQVNAMKPTQLSDFKPLSITPPVHPGLGDFVTPLIVIHPLSSLLGVGHLTMVTGVKKKSINQNLQLVDSELRSNHGITILKLQTFS